MLKWYLKSKIHNALITNAIVEYEGSLTVDESLMEAVGLEPGERVLVVSLNTGERLETYVIPAPAGTGRIETNGAAALKIKKGERVIIMAFGLSDTPIKPKKIRCGSHNLDFKVV